MGQLKESRDDLDVAVHWQARRDQALRPTVEQNHHDGKQKMGGARSVVGHSKNWPDSILIGIILATEEPVSARTKPYTTNADVISSPPQTSPPQRIAFGKDLGREMPNNSIRLLRFEFFQHCAAALTYSRIVLIFADMRRIVPATVALGAVRLFHLDVHTASAVARTLRQRDRRDDKQVAQLFGITLEHRVSRI